MTDHVFNVDGTRYQLVEHADPTLRGWFVCSREGVAMSGPYRSKREALSAALAAARLDELVGVFA